MPDLPGLWSLTPLGAFIGVLVLLFLMLASGKLLTRRQHEEVVHSKDQLIEIQEKAIDEWRLSAHTLQSRAVVLPNQKDADRLLHSGGSD